MPETIGIDEVRHLIEICNIPYNQISAGCGVSQATISRIANGSGANSDSVDRIAAFLRPLAPQSTPGAPQPSVISRDALMLILRQHQEQVTTLKRLARQRLRWIVILSIVLFAVVSWFLWDLTHPEVGLIRLKQAGYLVGQLRGLLGR